jgi:glycerol dehydrogenase
MIRVFGAPHRYVQGPGALAALPEWTGRLGGRPLLLIDKAVRPLVEPALAGAYRGLPPVLEFAGEVTFAAIDALAAAGRARAPSVVVGIGGGKALDAGKAVARALGAAVATVPSIASNDAPTSKIFVVYDENHGLIGAEHLERNPDLVLVDTALIARAPARFLRAGIGDAIAKTFEAEAAAAAGANTMHGTPGLWTARLLAEGCYRTLRAHAAEALAAAGRGEPDAAFERVVEAAILLSGLGFENGGLSIAHAMTRGLTACPATAPALHGEHVAWGLLVQLLIERRAAAVLADLRGFYATTGLPLRLADLAGKPVGEADMALIAERSLAAPHARNTAYPPDMTALLSAMGELERM